MKAWLEDRVEWLDDEFLAPPVFSIPGGEITPGFSVAVTAPRGEIFYTLKEAQVSIERWRQEYNTIRPHSSLGYLAPAPEATLWMPPETAFGLT